MGEHRFMMCHDCKQYVDLQKLGFSTYHEEGIDRGETLYVERLLRFLNDHKLCELQWTGEYSGTETGYPPNDYTKVHDITGLD